MDTWSRRKFLTLSGVVAATALAAGTRAQGVEEFLAAGTAQGAADDTPVLVLVTLYGGNDRLNTVVPGVGQGVPSRTPRSRLPPQRGSAAR